MDTREQAQRWLDGFRAKLVDFEGDQSGMALAYLGNQAEIGASHVAALLATPRTPEPIGDTREQVAREAGSGYVADWLTKEGRGFQVVYHGKEQRVFYADRDDAHEALAYLRADAILAALPPARDAEVNERECQAVWRCAVGDVTSALDVLKNRWINSRRKTERNAGMVLAGVLDLVWAYRDPAAGNYKQANANGKVLTNRVSAALSASDGKEGL